VSARCGTGRASLQPASARPRIRSHTSAEPILRVVAARVNTAPSEYVPDGTAIPDTLRELYRKVLDDTRIGPGSLLRRMAADPGPDAASVVRRNAADAVRQALSRVPQAASVRDIVQDWWRDQAPTTGVTVRDDMRQDVFRPLPVHLGALDETLTWCGEAAEAAGTRIDVELTVQDGTLHVWLGLDYARCGKRMEGSRLKIAVQAQQYMVVTDQAVGERKGVGQEAGEIVAGRLAGTGLTIYP
jgi:hypothetical protein